MGDVVLLERATPGSSFYRWKPILPDWPHPRTVTISIEQARAIDRDIRHLDALTLRMRDVRAISMILSRICGVDASIAERAARAVHVFLRTGLIT